MEQEQGGRLNVHPLMEEIAILIENKEEKIGEVESDGDEEKVRGTPQKVC